MKNLKPLPVRLRCGREVPYGKDCNCQSCIDHERGPLEAFQRFFDGFPIGSMCNEAWEDSRFNEGGNFFAGVAGMFINMYDSKGKR